MSQNSTDIDYGDFDIRPVPPEKLHAHNRRQLSAMLDGELSPDQARFMLRRLQHDAELAACWERWQVAGDILRGSGQALLPADFSRRVAAAIQDDTVAAGAAAAAAPEGRRQHRLLRWGGGAMAASLALVALFMARGVPEAPAPGLADAAGADRSAPALVQPALAAAGEAVDPSAPAAPGLGADASALLAAAPVVVAAAEVPRRAAEQRSSTRSQAQRAAARRATVAGAPVRALAAAAPAAGTVHGPLDAAPAAAVPALAGLPAAGSELFGTGQVASARPWPRPVLPGLARSAQPFAAGYGLPQAEAFAPFQPRLDGEPALPGMRPAFPAPVPQSAAADETAAGARPGAGRAR